jgi:uncharacterized protein
MKNNMTYITRNIETIIKATFKHYPIVTIVGARQTGKSTLAKHAFAKKPYVNLEAPDIQTFAKNDPRRFLDQYPDGAILDEIQNVPELLSYLQVTVDEQNRNELFILTGSHQAALHKFVSQSLAGRTAIFELLPLSIAELTKTNIDLKIDQYLLQGFYPRIYKENLNPTQAYRDYVKTYLERDLRNLLNVKNLTQFQNFLRLCASRIGQILNINNLCNEAGVSNHTAKEWLSILEASYLIIKLQPYYENFGKRIIKSQKIYFNDVGLAAYLLNIHTIDQIKRDPLRGQLIENLIVIELFKYLLNQNLPASFYFYRDNNMNEVDIIFKKGNHLIPIEIKASQTFHQEFLKGLKYFNKILPKASPEGYLIYTGEHEQKIENFSVLNYKNIQKIFID